MTRVKIPRDKQNDYTAQSVQTRRDFVREQTGTGLHHMEHYSFDSAHLYSDLPMRSRPGISVNG